MAKMLRDEMQVLKGIMMNIDDNTALLATQQYHTETDPSTGKLDRSKSAYRWVARVDTIENFKKLVSWYMDDSRRLVRGQWPNDPDKSPYFCCVGDGSENWRIGNFFNNKIKKICSWEQGQKLLNGWKNETEKHDEGYVQNAKYVIEGYVAPDGSTLALTDKTSLLKHLGETIVAPHFMKSKLPRTAPAAKASKNADKTAA